MWMRFLSSGTTVLVALAVLRGNQLPGSPCDPVKADEVVGLGCGQFPGTTGNSACTANPGTCPQVWSASPYAVGFSCTSPGAQCGSCGGAVHTTCQGTVNPLASDFCYTYTQTCCVLNSCKQHSVYDPNQLRYLLTCNCNGGLSQGGTLTKAAVHPNAPQCGGGGGT